MKTLYGPEIHHGLDGDAYQTGVFVLQPGDTDYIWFDSLLTATTFIDMIIADHGGSVTDYFLTAEQYNKGVRL